MSLTPTQKRIAKKIAKSVIPTPTPCWMDLGEDRQNEMRQQLQERLENTENTGIAKIIEMHPKEGDAILKEKVKSMRQEQLKKSM